MNSENYTIDTAADAFSTSTRNIRSLIQREIIPRTIEIEGQMDVYSRDRLRAFLVKLPPTLVAKESGISFDTVKRLQAKGGSVGYKGSSLRKVSAYVNTLLTPLLAE